MDSPTFPYTDEELSEIGLLGEGVSEYAAHAVQTMRDHPKILQLSLFALQCIDQEGRQSEGPNSPALSDTSMTSRFSALTFASETTVVSEYSPDAYERATYYNGITGDNDHPDLVYRSDYATTPFPKPTGRFSYIPTKSVRGVYDTPLNKVWDTVGPQIRDIIKQRVEWTSIDPARFFTHAPPGEETEQYKGTLGPVVIWVGVPPGSISSDTAHDISQLILALLEKNGVNDVVVEWREAVPQKLTGPPLLPHVGSADASHYARRFLTPLLGVPLATEEMEKSDSQGTLTLYFHENKYKDGNPSDRVFGVSNCHVLRKNTKSKYDNKGGAPRYFVRVCGMRRFQRGLNEITKAIADHGVLADYWAREIVKLERTTGTQSAKELRRARLNLEEEQEAISDLEALHRTITAHWSDIKLQRNIGYLQYAPPITVDQGGTEYTSDWAAFLVAEAKVRNAFEGNVVDLGSKYHPNDLTKMFYPTTGGSTTFKFPEGRKLQIVGCATKDDLASPTERDDEGQRCLIVAKDGNTTDLTIGKYAGLESFAKNEVGVESRELAIYNLKGAFSEKGDSGALVWHTKDGKARIVGQLHSGHNKGEATSNHVTYCTPGWYLLAQIKKEFKHAVFYGAGWSIREDH